MKMKGYTVLELGFLFTWTKPKFCIKPCFYKDLSENHITNGFRYQQTVHYNMTKFSLNYSLKIFENEKFSCNSF